jgi:hypothetical protein
MDGAILSQPDRPLVRTGPIAQRDRGPNGRPLGTPDDCYEDSPWELHRGELVERPVSYDIHAVVMGILTALFHVHARDGYTIMDDIDCVLDDDLGESRRAPDVAIVHQLENPKGEAYRGIPVLAVEIRATQRKKHLEEKVALYIDHDWPTVWLVHTEGRKVEVVKKGLASVVYRIGTSVPMIPELDKYGLSTVPVSAFFDDVESSTYIDAWVKKRSFSDGRKKGLVDGRKKGLVDGHKKGIADGHKKGIVDGRTRERARALLDVLLVRGFDVPANVRERITSCTDLDTLQRWFTRALTATNAHAFVKSLDE